MATPTIFINMLSTPQTNWQWNKIVHPVGETDLFGGRQMSSGAHNAEISYDFYAASGTYTFDLFLKFGTDRGIYTVQIDGVGVGTIDGYNATNVSGKSFLAGITIATTGVHRLRLLMATKNAASTAYAGLLHGAYLTRTGA